jgi:hypothetical protein
MYDGLFLSLLLYMQKVCRGHTVSLRNRVAGKTRTNGEVVLPERQNVGQCAKVCRSLVGRSNKRIAQPFFMDKEKIG